MHRACCATGSHDRGSAYFCFLEFSAPGVVAYFMSQPVLLGFTSGAAILISSSQLPLRPRRCAG